MRISIRSGLRSLGVSLLAVMLLAAPQIPVANAQPECSSSINGPLSFCLYSDVVGGYQMLPTRSNLGPWKSLASTTEPSNWTDPRFNDSAWNVVRAPYPNPSLPGAIFNTPGPSSFMWDASSSSLDGGGPPNEVFFRFTFFVQDPHALFPDMRAFSPRFGSFARSAADDDYELFFNGHLLVANHDEGSAEIVSNFDLAPYLRVTGDESPTDPFGYGINTIAIHAKDGGWSSAFDRSYQWVLFESVIQFEGFDVPVPEPGTLASFAAGLLALIAARRRLSIARR